MIISINVRVFLIAIMLLVFTSPSLAVTTKMFRVLDTCARYSLGEKDAFEAIDKLNLNYEGKDKAEVEIILKKYCSVFTPNERVEF